MRSTRWSGTVNVCDMRPRGLLPHSMFVANVLAETPFAPRGARSRKGIKGLTRHLNRVFFAILQGAAGSATGPTESVRSSCRHVHAR